MSKHEVTFELDHHIEATLVYNAVEYPEGLSLDIDHVYYGYGDNKHDMSFCWTIRTSIAVCKS